MSELLLVPPYSGGLPPRATLAATALPVDQQQLTVAAIGAPIPYGWGRMRLGAMIANAVLWGTELVITAIIGEGEIDGVESVELNDAAPPAGTLYRLYTGTATQPVDDWLAAAYAAQGRTYADALPGIAYVVLRLPNNAAAGISSLNLIARLRKVIDYRRAWIATGGVGKVSVTKAGIAQAGAFTVEAWVKVPTANPAAITPWIAAWIVELGGNAYPGGAQYLVFQQDGATADRWRVGIYGRRSTDFSLVGASYTFAAGEPAPGSIHHVAGVYDGAWMRVYWDGNLVAAVNVGAYTWAASNNVCQVTGGGDAAVGDGYVADLRVWSKARPPTAAAIATDPMRNESGLVLWWRGRIVAGTAADSSPSAAHGTATLASNAGLLPARYSTNPVLGLADWLTNASFGRGEAVDGDSVAAVAEIADEVVGLERRREFGFWQVEQRDVDQVEETLRDYAGCWIVRDAGVAILVPDAPAAPTHVFTNAPGAANYVRDSLQISLRGRAQAPSVVTVRYTDTSTTPWSEVDLPPVKAPGVDADPRTWRESAVSLPGIQSPSQAYRAAVRRLNDQLLSDLTVRFQAVDAALAMRQYDVFTLTDSEGFAAKPFRATDVRLVGPGRWEITGMEYQSGVYSDAVATGPDFPDTGLPSVSSPVAPTTLGLSEEIFQKQNGLYATRVRVTWVEPASYPFIEGYDVELLDGLTRIELGPAFKGTPTFASKEVAEGKAYTVRVRTRTPVGTVSAWLQGSITIVGKAAIPGDVPSIDELYEIAGEVRMRWTPAVDLDLEAHIIKWGAAANWASMSLLERVAMPAVRYTTKVIPPGTWYIGIKALDSVRNTANPYGQESAAAIFRQVVVTSDQNAFLADQYAFTNPALTNMQAYQLDRADPTIRYVTEDNVAAGTKWPAAMGTYANALARYHNNVTSTLLTESRNVGLLLTGSWTAEASVSMLSGTIAVQEIQSSLDGSAWVAHGAMAAKTTAQYGRVKLEALTSATMLVLRPALGMRIDAVLREEAGEITTNGSGTKLVELANAYVAAQNIQVTPKGATAVIGQWDDVQLSPVSIRCAGLRFSGTGVYGFCYLNLAYPSYTIQAGDVLKCEVYADPSNAGDSVVGCGVVPSTGTYCFAHSTTVRGQWVTKSAAFNADTIGAAVSAVLHEADTAAPHTGDWRFYVRNVRIEDGSGNLRAQLWASGDVVGTAFSVSAVTGYSSKPMNTFRLYSFTDAGAAAASKDLRWQFKGV